MKNLKFAATICFAITSLFFLACSEENTTVKDLDLQNVFSNNIKYEENGRLVDISKEYLSSKWDKSLKEEGFENMSLSSFKIIESDPDTNGETAFFIIASSEDGSVETGAQLIKEGSFYKIGPKTCTCVGCPNGCQLQVTGTICTCSGCFPQGGKCEKTETIIVG